MIIKNCIKSDDKVEPKFKHGVRVKNKKSGVTQILGSCIEDVYEGAFPFHIKEQDNWELVEQNTAWNEEDEYLLGETIQHLEELIRIDKVKYCSVDVQYYQRDIDWLKSLKNRVQPNCNEWSEEDEKYWSIVIAEFSKCAGKSVSKDEWMRCNDWLNSLRNRVQSQQKWNEEDEKMHDFAIRAVGLCRQYAINHQVNGYSNLPDVPKRYEELQNWLKSLKQRYTWKPSEEQLKSLKGVIDVGYFTSYPRALETLYEQLKQF